MKQYDTEKARDYKLRSRYGMTLVDYNVMLQRQHRKCAVCHRPASSFSKALSVDHNHKTSHVRGLLCTHCNTNVMKFLRDDKSLVRGLIDYLRNALFEDIDWE